LRDLSGFDDAFAAAFEDTDLCLRIREAHQRVVFDPAVMVRRLEADASPPAAEPLQRVQSGHDIFPIGLCQQVFERGGAAHGRGYLASRQ
jgi:hypothetical protein